MTYEKRHKACVAFLSDIFVYQTLKEADEGEASDEGDTAHNATTTTTPDTVPGNTETCD
jgi:hypothetical protein